MTFDKLFQDGRRPFEMDHTAAADRAKPEFGVEIRNARRQGNAGDGAELGLRRSRRMA